MYAMKSIYLGGRWLIRRSFVGSFWFLVFIENIKYLIFFFQWRFFHFNLESKCKIRIIFYQKYQTVIVRAWLRYLTFYWDIIYVCWRTCHGWKNRSVWRSLWKCAIWREASKLKLKNGMKLLLAWNLKMHFTLVD